ncbi:methyltransferase domain-containing protein [bacterium]|nr:methyltransferase domain-containing protein [bacterium]
MSQAPRDHSEPHVRVQRTREGTFLFVDGSCASVWRPGRAITEGSWDLLAAPVLLVAGQAPRVLLLGVGGGTVIRVIRALRPAAAVTAIDLDREVLAVARRAFALDRLGATIVCAEADAYLRSLPAPARFDVVIDDIYERAGAAMRKPRGWPATLRRALARLRPGGVLVCNALDRRDARALARALRRPATALTHAEYHNCILLFGRPTPGARAVGRALRASPPLRPTMQRVTVRTFTAADR